MKRIVTAISILGCLKGVAQTDTTKILNVALQARTIEYLAGNLVNPDNDDFFSTFLKWRALFRQTQPTGTTLVTIDTLPVSVAIYLYTWTMRNPEGLNYTTPLKSVLSPFRTTNSNLNRQMTDVENIFSNQVIQQRLMGRRWLLGK